MKKVLLILAVAGGLMTGKAQVTFNCTGDVPVSFGPDAAAYITGGLDCSSNADSVVLKPGSEVYVQGAFNSNERFVLQNDGTNNAYGQLIINDGTETNSASQLVMKKLIRNNDLIVLSFPFLNYTYTDFQTNAQKVAPAFSVVALAPGACPGNGVQCGLRYAATLFLGNSAENLAEQITTDKPVLIPTDYYSMLLTRSNATPLRGKVVPFQGRATSGATVANVQISPVPFTYGNGEERNKYGESYKTYVKDPFIALTSNPNYGANFWYLGNPFTSNIDISQIGIDEGTPTLPLVENDQMAFGGMLQGVAFFKENGSYDPQTGSVGTQFVVTTADSNGVFTGGDVDALVVPPVSGFYIKFSPLFNSGTLDFIFKDGIKTFQTETRAKSQGFDPFPNSRIGRANRSAKTDNTGYNIGLNFSKSNSDEVLDRFFVIVSDEAPAGEENRLEAIKGTLAADAAYTLAESVNGGPSATDKSYRQINGVDMRFKAKSIPVGLKVATAGSYTFSTRLMSEAGKLVDKYSNPAVKFYFHDIDNNEYLEITKDFSYTANLDAGTNNSRFEIFYAELPSQIIEQTPQTGSNLTQIYVDEYNDIVVRMVPAELGNTAEIYVHNAIGQLLYANESASTSVKDYRLDLYNLTNGVYIVTVKGESGVVVQNKVVK